MLKDQKETMDDRNVNEKNQRNIAIRRSGKELRVQREGLTREWCESRQAKRRAIIIKTKEKLDRGIVKEGLEGVLRKNKQVLSRSKNKIRLRKDNK